MTQRVVASETEMINFIEERFKQTIVNIDNLPLKRELKERLTISYIEEQDNDFPPKESRRFDNYLVAVLDVKEKDDC